MRKCKSSGASLSAAYPADNDYDPLDAIDQLLSAAYPADNFCVCVIERVNVLSAAYPADNALIPSL